MRSARTKLAADPNNVALVLALSKAEAGRRQYKEALATCTKELSVAPQNADLYVERGHRELGLREFRQAMQDLKRATELAPNNLDAHYHLGLAHYFLGEFSAAATSFEAARALAKNDNLIDCSNRLYVSLRRAGQESRATEALARITPEVTNTEPTCIFICGCCISIRESSRKKRYCRHHPRSRMTWKRSFPSIRLGMA